MNAEDFSREDRADAHVDGRAVHVDGVAERNREGSDRLRGAEPACSGEVGGERRSRRAGREGDEPGLEDALQELDRVGLADDRNNRDEDQEDENHRRDEGREDEGEERKEHCEAVLRNREGDEAEDADRGVHHDVARDADHHVAHDFKEAEDGLAAFAEGREPEAEDHRKEDDLEHGALGHRFHRIDRNDVEERIRQARGLHGLGDEAVGREVKTEARLNEVRKEQTDRHGDGRRDGIDDKDLAGNAAELRGIRNAGGARNDRGDDERHHHHADQADEERAQWLQIGLGELGVDNGADDDAERKADHHLPGQ